MRNLVECIERQPAVAEVENYFLHLLPSGGSLSLLSTQISLLKSKCYLRLGAKTVNYNWRWGFRLFLCGECSSPQSRPKNYHCREAIKGSPKDKSEWRRAMQRYQCLHRQCRFNSEISTRESISKESISAVFHHRHYGLVRKAGREAKSRTRRQSISGFKFIANHY